MESAHLFIYKLFSCICRSLFNFSRRVGGVYLSLIVLISLTVFESAVPLALVPIFARHTKNAVVQLEEITSKNEEDGTLHLKGVIKQIQLQDVSYWYPAATRPALDHLYLNIQAGQKIAIIGPSGCGKTTLLQLLMKEIKRTSGDIRINTTDIDMISSQSMYAYMSTMLQHNHFFSGTIKSNLLMANNEASDEALQVVLEKAQLNKKLEAPVFEKGGNLSGGEKQRLAFARLLLKESNLWIVDEPFTSLDVQTEKLLYNTLHEEAFNKTVVMVTHSLARLDQFDRICVMLQGKIAECGSHQQLLAEKGLYYKMLNQ